MNELYKKLWVEALRSGVYEQGKSVLRNDTEFCCLGVIADEVAPNNWSKESGTYYHTFTYNITTHKTYGTLSHTLCDFLGISATEMGLLINMNDSGKTFAEIADWIEGNL